MSAILGLLVALLAGALFAMAYLRVLWVSVSRTTHGRSLEPLALGAGLRLLMLAVAAIAFVGLEATAQEILATLLGYLMVRQITVFACRWARPASRVSRT